MKVDVYEGGCEFYDGGHLHEDGKCLYETLPLEEAHQKQGELGKRYYDYVEAKRAEHMLPRCTFKLVTDEAVHGNFETLLLHADKLPAKKHGMEQWELKYIYNGKLIHTHVVKCSPGKGAAEAQAIISEAAPYWSRRAWERSFTAPVYEVVR